ncbi:MAG: hypothetical protein EAZ85_07830 [Bacteroidetes bacterium]|nr:MAG: hypothetical protein EAZ85_07830 [Bacteroidota bacterium]TAG88167.1 MAG: hypothetical protein EAZ20_09075 [Bacteroidota bacterium]
MNFVQAWTLARDTHWCKRPRLHQNNKQSINLLQKIKKNLEISKIDFNFALSIQKLINRA